MVTQAVGAFVSFMRQKEWFYLALVSPISVSVIGRMFWLKSLCFNRYATAKPNITPVCGPAAAILSFAWPKESIQRKGHPDAALILRAGGFERGFRKGFPSPPKTRGIPAAPLSGWSAQTLRCSVRHRGIKTTRCAKKRQSILLNRQGLTQNKDLRLVPMTDF
jgi:hypothetical protein